KGVAVCSTPERMRDAIRPYSATDASEPEDLWGGAVKYYDFLKVRLRPSNNQRYFSKHLAFSWEREFRLLISLMQASEFVPGLPSEGIEVEVDVSRLVERIMLGPALSKDEMDIVIE